MLKDTLQDTPLSKRYECGVRRGGRTGCVCFCVSLRLSASLCVSLRLWIYVSMCLCVLRYDTITKFVNIYFFFQMVASSIARYYEPHSNRPNSILFICIGNFYRSGERERTKEGEERSRYDF